MSHSLKRDTALRERARAVIPGGMYGHQNATMMPEGFPQYFVEGSGCRVRDVDGNEYIDFMCSYGPVLLGHRHPAVEDAVHTQLARGDCFNGPGPSMVELAERLVDRVGHADWALFQKNGTDATTLCVTIARAATGRRKLLVASGAYHGAAPWCTPIPAGVVAEDRANIGTFVYNDLAGLREAADAAGDELAAVLVSPLKHDVFVDEEMVDPDFARGLRSLCDERGALLLLDEVRAGLRMARGGSWEALGVAPDLSAWSKALANGYPIAAVLGAEAHREAATQVFSTGSFWFSTLPMVAALATLEAADAEDAHTRVVRAGERFRKGLTAQSASHDLPLRQSGPPQMPMLLFDNDPQFEIGRRFTASAARRGVFLHPYHNLFLCAAHDDAAIDAALAHTDEAFRDAKASL
jgi:glutamate-1-semialdehyde 2,1-aminomutase